MSLKISRVVSLGAGTKGFRFKNKRDSLADEEQYQRGRDLEKARLSEGSIAYKVYLRLRAKKAV